MAPPKLPFLVLVTVCIGHLPSCTLVDNIDSKAPVHVPVETLWSNALADGIRLIDNIDQNVNINRMLCQHISLVQYVDPSRYDFQSRQIPDGYWNNAYLALRDLHEVHDMLEEEIVEYGEMLSLNRANRRATVDIIQVLLYHNLVDLFGDVPYSLALKGYEDKTPAYDDAQTIYFDLLDRLAAAMETLQKGSRAGCWGEEDLVYGGDVGMWLKCASTLRVRLGMRFADVDPALAQEQLNAALDAGCFSPGESMQLHWLGVVPHVNPIYQSFEVNNRNDYVPSRTITHQMNELEDARRAAFFTQVDTSYMHDGSKMVYLGARYGFLGCGTYWSMSHFGDEMFRPDFPSTMLCYAELEFLLAEAAARGLNTDGRSAEEHYTSAIEESHRCWGVDMDPDYMDRPGVAWDPNRARELIGKQKWIALYNRGNEGYASWRMLDWPVLPPPEEMTMEEMPLRMPYPYNEADLNGENYAAASVAIGGDSIRTRIFWDIRENSGDPPAGF